MGVLAASSSTKSSILPATIKRRSGHLDFSSLGPLTSTGTVGFSSFRDQVDQSRRRKARKKGPSANDIDISMNEDSEEDEYECDVLGRIVDGEDGDISCKVLAPDDAKSQGELADGLGKIRVSIISFICILMLPSWPSDPTSLAI
jgi:hypothetical protein